MKGGAGGKGENVHFSQRFSKLSVCLWLEILFLFAISCTHSSALALCQCLVVYSVRIAVPRFLNWGLVF